jgi:uncharacterized protein
VNHAREIYNFHKRHGLDHMQFIPCVEPDGEGAASYSVDAEAYGRFLCELFDLWINDFRQNQPTTSIRWFDSVFYTYVDLGAPECTLLPECGIYVVIEHNGDVYACDFYVDPQWHLGNILRHDLAAMLNSPLQKKFGSIKSNRPSACAACPWLKRCWGGCPKDRNADPRDRGVSHFCRSYIIFFEHADQRLRLLAEEWKRQGETYTRSPDPQHQTIDRNEPCPCGSGDKYIDCCGSS